jgi:hypothetical protein
MLRSLLSVWRAIWTLQTMRMRLISLLKPGLWFFFSFLAFGFVFDLLVFFF